MLKNTEAIKNPTHPKDLLFKNFGEEYIMSTLLYKNLQQSNENSQKTNHGKICYYG